MLVMMPVGMLHRRAYHPTGRRADHGRGDGDHGHDHARPLHHVAALGAGTAGREPRPRLALEL
jgi:hypothetical protein